jgi:hypothetical protein
MAFLVGSSAKRLGNERVNGRRKIIIRKVDMVNGYKDMKT